MVDRYRTRHEGWNVRHFLLVVPPRRRGAQLRLGEGPSAAGGRGAEVEGPRQAPQASRARAVPGMLLHQDGSDHEWVEAERWDLIATMDDATSEH